MQQQKMIGYRSDKVCWVNFEGAEPGLWGSGALGVWGVWGVWGVLGRV